MPKMKICPKGHYYDSVKYATCPYCSPSGGGGGSKDPGKTNPVDPPVNHSDNRDHQSKKGGGKTKSPWDDMFTDTTVEPIAPVIGWLVCTEGKDFGRDFRLHPDNNFVGRGDQCDVRLSDEYVSAKHFTVSYDPFSDIHFASMSDGRAIVYVNGIPLTANMVQLKKGDKIKVAKTTLVFIPLEKDDVQWNWGL